MTKGNISSSVQTDNVIRAKCPSKYLPRKYSNYNVYFEITVLDIYTTVKTIVSGKTYMTQKCCKTFTRLKNQIEYHQQY